MDSTSSSPRRASVSRSKDLKEDASATPEIDEDIGDSCLICLGEIIDQTILPKCQHSLFCFDCITKWISIHRRCPLCSTSIEGYIIHSIRSEVDYIRHHLPMIESQSGKDSSSDAFDPLRLQADLSQNEARRIRRQLQHRVRRDQLSGAIRPSGSHRDVKPEWGQIRVEERQRDAIAHWDQRLAFRRRIYEEGLYCYHRGSNATTKLTSPPSHSAISSSPLIESTLLSFIRRELLAYPLNIDVDFLSRYTIHVFKSFDCKSEEAINLMGEFLGSRGANQFCHECYTFSRFIGQASARQRDKVKAFDEWAQYQPTRSVPRQERPTKSVKEGLKVEEDISTHAKEIKEEIVSADRETSSPPTTRQSVIKGRERLLQRLEEERMRYTRSNSFNESTQDKSVTEAFVIEKALKDKLLLQKKEAMLRNQTSQGRAKRIKT
jgi:hypothetical protein